MTATIVRNPSFSHQSAVVSEHRDIVRTIIVRAVEAGKSLTKAETAELQRLLRGRPIGVFVTAARRFADAVADGDDVTSGLLSELLSDGPVAALMLVAKERKALADAFEQTDYARRERASFGKLQEARRLYLEAKADEDTPTMKLRRLHQESVAKSQAHNELINSADPQRIAFRHSMKPTAARDLDAFDWRNFLI